MYFNMTWQNSIHTGMLHKKIYEHYEPQICTNEQIGEAIAQDGRLHICPPSSEKLALLSNFPNYPYKKIDFFMKPNFKGKLSKK